MAGVKKNHHREKVDVMLDNSRASNLVWNLGGALLISVLLVVGYEQFSPSSDYNKVSASVSAESELSAYIVKEYNDCIGVLSDKTRKQCTDSVIDKAYKERHTDPKEVNQIISKLVDRLVSAGFRNAAN